jgi:hypothetical protein
MVSVAIKPPTANDGFGVDHQRLFISCQQRGMKPTVSYQLMNAELQSCIRQGKSYFPYTVFGSNTRSAITCSSPSVSSRKKHDE